MSYWVSLENDEGDQVIVDRHSEGGTIVVGGTSVADINITYNYGPIIREVLHEGGIPWLDGKRASETLPSLEAACDQLPDDAYSGPFWVPAFPLPEGGREVWNDIFGAEIKDTNLDEYEGAEELRHARLAGLVRDGGSYWKPTRGNVGHVLHILLAWARQHPDATWRVS